MDNGVGVFFLGYVFIWFVVLFMVPFFLARLFLVVVLFLGTLSLLFADVIHGQIPFYVVLLVSIPGALRSLFPFPFPLLCPPSPLLLPSFRWCLICCMWACFAAPRGYGLGRPATLGTFAEPPSSDHGPELGGCCIVHWSFSRILFLFSALVGSFLIFK